MNVISKADLVDKEELDRVLDMDSAAMVSRMGHLASHGRLQPLTRTIASVVDDYALVGFLPLNRNDEDSIDTVLTQVDMVRTYSVRWYLPTDTHCNTLSPNKMKKKSNDTVNPVWRGPGAAGAKGRRGRGGGGGGGGGRHDDGAGRRLRGWRGRRAVKGM